MYFSFKILGEALFEFTGLIRHYLKNLDSPASRRNQRRRFCFVLLFLVLPLPLLLLLIRRLCLLRLLLLRLLLLNGPPYYSFSAYYYSS